MKHLFVILLIAFVSDVAPLACGQEIDLSSAIQKARPGARWVCGETYASLQWLDAVHSKPTLHELETAWSQVLTERAAKLADDAARLLKKESVGSSVATLRQWSTDAATTHTNWPTMTAGQKDAANREVIRRLGLFFGHFADLIEAQSLDKN